MSTKEQEKLQTSFGDILRHLRNKAGISQEQLALNCGLDRIYISLLERGLRQPTLLSTLFTLANSLQIKPSKLITKIESHLDQF